MHYKKLTLFIIAFIAFSIGIFSPNSTARAATFDVTSCANDGMGSFRQAVISSNGTADPDNVINFTINCNVILESSVTITRSVTINSNGFHALDGGGLYPILQIDPNITVTINNLTFRNGVTSGGGGAIFVAGSNLILNGASFYNNTADYGGAIFINGGSVSANMTLFSENETQSDPTTQLGGAIFVVTSEINITNSIFQGNTAMLGGAIALDITSSGEIADNTFISNTAEEGGAIRLTNENDITTRIERNTFTQNSATAFGGAIYLSNSLAYINRNTFTENNAQISGGAVVLNNSSGGYISNNIFNNNSTVNNEGSSIASGAGSTFMVHHNTFISTQSQIAEFGSDVFLRANIFVGGACTGAGIADNGNNIAHNSTGCPGATIDPMLDPVSFAPQAGGIEYPAPCHLIIAEDYNGVARPLGSACTPGAIEVDGTGGTESPVAVVLPPDPFALGCVLTMDIDIAGAPDNTYCRVLMRNGAVIGYSGAVPAELIGLGVKFAVDVYMLDGGRSITDFGGYYRVCLSGTGRLFYLDARNAPRHSVEMATEQIGGATCGWIPAAGTLVLTN